MTISITRYVDITSGVAGANQIPDRKLIGRLFTTNPLVPTDSVINFTSADEVGEYFGTSSDEYKRAVFYFGWISKNRTRAQSIDYARWADTDVAPRIYGNSQEQLLATWTAITTGSLGITIGADVNTFTSLDFSSAASLAAVAGILQTAIRTKTGTQWTAATVTYDATRQSFNFVGGDPTAANATISVQQGVGGTPIGNILGWLSGPTLILSNGSLEQSITEVLTDSSNSSNNFATFLFMPTLTIDEITEAAEWNNAQNVLYAYCIPVSSANASSYSAALIDIGGCQLTLNNLSTEYPEQVMMMILAATDYTSNNAAQNYMFQIFDLTPTVTSDSSADLYDGLRINYYGSTQESGQIVNFYQRGFMMGLPTDPLLQNVYANEIWFKSAMSTALMNLLLALNQIPANNIGRGQILNSMQSVINQAINNGTISVGKTLTPTQITDITEITDDPTAWYDVQNQGYWVDCVIRPDDNDPYQYIADYTLVYSKDDVINKIIGQQVLV